QGTMFRDGGHFVTPALERRIDEIAQSYPGFFVGRFDIRYSDVDAFTRGEDVAIVELNGVTAESTNIYDPAGSLLCAYRTLFRQWAISFAIGAANRRGGAPTSSLARLLAVGHAPARGEFRWPVADWSVNPRLARSLAACFRITVARPFRAAGAAGWQA